MLKIAKKIAKENKSKFVLDIVDESFSTIDFLRNAKQIFFVYGALYLLFLLVFKCFLEVGTRKLKFIPK